MIKYVSLFALVLSLGACSHSGGGSNSGSGGSFGDNSGCPAGSQCDFQVNGKSAKDYYGQFVYHVEGNCSDSANLRFAHLGSDPDALIIGDDGQGHKISASVDLYLEGNGRYTGIYQEYTMISLAGNIAMQERNPAQTFSGTWRLDGVGIVISGVGNGTGINYNGTEVIDFKLQGFAPNGTLDGNLITMGKTLSNLGKDNQSINTYCAAHGGSN